MAYAGKRNGSWWVRWQLAERNEKGRHLEGYEDGFRTKDTALKYGRDQEAAIRARTWIDPKLGERTVGEWWGEWFPVQRYRPNTRESYEQHWRKHIGPRWGSTPLAAIRPLKMEEWINSLRDRYAASTVAVITAPLSDCLADAVRNKMISVSPMPPKDRRGRESVTPPKPKREGVVVPLDQVEQIMLRLRGDEALMVLIALFTGMRWSELAAMRRRFLVLRAADASRAAAGYYVIDPAKGAVHEDKHSRRFLGPPKSGASGSLGPGYPPGRVIDLPPFLVVLLLAYLAALPQQQDVLFPNRLGGYRQYDAWNRDRWRPACDGRAAEVTPRGRAREAVAPVHAGLHLHDLKHTQAALLNNGRIHPVMRDYRLGHAAAGAPGTYAHPTPEMRAELIEWLEQVWQQWQPVTLIEALAAWLLGRNGPPRRPARNLLAAARILPAADNALF